MSRYFRILCVMALLAGITPLHSIAADPLQAGDAAYRARAYDSAAVLYTRAASSGNAEAFYKLGNAHYRAHRTGEAMVAYCKALQGRPGFAAAAHNIRTIQEGLKYGPAAAGKGDAALVRGWQAATGSDASNIWAGLGLCVFCALISVAAIRRWRGQKGYGMQPMLFAASLIIALAFAALAVYAARKSVPQNAGVIMRPDALFMRGANDAVALNLPEGLLVQVTHIDAKGIRILLPNGQSGIVQSADIALLK